MAGKRGFEIFELEDGTLIEWDRCEVPNCPNFVCIRQSDDYCHPHSNPNIEQLRQLTEAPSNVPS